MPGYEPVEGALMIESAKNIPHSAEAADLKIVLDKVGTIPSEMVRVHGDKFSPNLEFLKSAVMPALQLENYLLDRYEVTNRQFKEFIEAGGYRKPEFWKHKFVKDGRELTRDEAMKLLLDRTGQPGPAAWELGDYPQGEDDLPVAGISWYEAAAYAEFVSKSLPTVYHWNFALGNGEDADFIMHLSNFGGKGPTPVGKCNGMASCGIYDLAGNIKEWCWNETADRKRLILGGAWNENNDAMNRVDIRSPLSREANFGFRCMKLIKQDNTSQEAAKPVSIVEPATAPLVELKPCSDEVFRIYKKLYDYNKTALNPTIEFTEDVNKYTRLEKVSFDTAYGDERMAAYLFIPRLGKPPFQTVIYYPGSGAWTNMSFFEYSSKDCADRLTKTGRAFVFPIIADTFERRMLPEKLKKTTELERSIMVVKDFMRTVDYLETRPELDVQKLAYEGISLGAAWGSVVPAIEARIKAAVLISGGLMQLPQECSQVNFAPRIKIPILMQNGEYDWGFRLETFQKPLFRLLGTLEKDKFHKIYEAGHDVWVKNEWIKDELDFLDKYLGPVK
jgi:dienelactone hydrolase